MPEPTDEEMLSYYRDALQREQRRQLEQQYAQLRNVYEQSSAFYAHLRGETFDISNFQREVDLSLTSIEPGMWLEHGTTRAGTRIGSSRMRYIYLGRENVYSPTMPEEEEYDA